MRCRYFYRKMAKLSANSGDPCQTPRFAASDLGLLLFAKYPFIPFYGSPDYNGLSLNSN